MMRKLDRLVALLENTLAFILVVGVLVIVALQIVFRFFLHSPLSWSEELATYVLVWTAFLGLAIAQRDHSHISVQIFPKINASPLGRWSAWVGMVVLFCLIGSGGFNLAIQNGEEQSPAMGLPFWVVYMILPISSVLGLYHCARAIPDLLKPPKPPHAWGQEFEARPGDATPAPDVIPAHSK
ncbi:MAG TPA: TRAP transporter small permease [Candidatus Acidoferrales bacterium]|nr:TRAP transporter small permease [Candidatus Acidoferrales bacterium]